MLNDRITAFRQPLLQLLFASFSSSGVDQAKGKQSSSFTEQIGRCSSRQIRLDNSESVDP